MEGDLADLMTLLRLTDSAQDTCDKDDPIRQEYAARAHKLIAVFENVEKAHRRAYGLSGDRKPAAVSFHWLFARFAPGRIFLLT